MVSIELSDTHERLRERQELHEEAVKFGNIVKKLGGALVIISIIYFFVTPTFNLPTGGNGLGGIFGLGLLVLVIGQRIIDQKALLAPFSIEEQKFLNAVDSLEDIETFQKEGIEYSRIEAAKRLSEFEKQLIEPQFQGELWENLTKEANENMGLLKRNIKERLIPSIIQGTEEDINKAHSILEKFAQYLLNPTISELKNLNKPMLELTLYPPEKSRLIPLFGHPYVRHIYVLITFCIAGIFAYHLSKYMGSSIDSAITNGFYLFGALAAGYMILMVKKG